MKRIIALVFCLFGCLFARAQNTITTENPYFYDEFKDGTVFFLSGERADARFNYHFVLEVMQFLDRQNNNQILNLSHKSDFTHIQIGNDIFVPLKKQGFAFVTQDGPVTLLEKKRLVGMEKKRGAYGTPGTSASIDVVGQLATGVVGSQSVSLLAPEYDYLVLEKYYLMKNRKVYAATKRNYLRLYPQIRSQLEQYLSVYKVNFNNGEQLRSLSRYCNDLLMEINKF